MRDERILFNDFTLPYELFRLRRFGAAAKIASAGPKKPKRPATRCDKERLVANGYRPRSGSIRSASGGRTWWAHFEFTRINITPTILLKKIEDLRQLGAFHSGRHYAVYRELLLDRRRELPRAGIRGATAQAACSGREAGGEWDCEDSTVGMTIDLPQDGEEQRPGVTVKGRTRRGPCY